MITQLLLARSPTAAIYISYLDAYPTGLMLEVNVIASAEHGFDTDILGLFGRHCPVVGKGDSELPPHLLRIGIQFSDGRKATNVAGHDHPAEGPVMWPLGGGGGGGRFTQGYWVSPLPPCGPLELVCEWPAVGIPLTRRELDAQLILDAAERARATYNDELTRVKDGREWRIGTDAEVTWINDGVSPGRWITAAIPPIFASYCTLMLPQDREAELKRHEQAVIALLSEHTERQPWWLGYLDAGPSDIVFPGAPMATVYYGYRYLLVEAGPQQALTWRHAALNWKLPDLMFPTDRSWLASTMWDDDWTSIGGPEDLISSLLDHSELGARARRATVGEDATPPGHEAR